MHKDFESYFDEVKSIAEECGTYINDQEDFREAFKMGLSPDDAYNQWVLEKE